MMLFEHEQDTCLNNLKLNLNVSSTKADYIREVGTKQDQLNWRSGKPNLRDTLESSSQKDRYARGSLDNVSRIPWQEAEGQATLRWTRSFAISRDNLFYSLDYSWEQKRRSQLIPRARLVEKSFIRDSRFETLRIESIRKVPQKTSNRPPEIPPDYSPLPQSNSYKNIPLDENIYDIPPIYITRNNSPFSDTNQGKLTESSNQFLDNTPYIKSFEDLAGLSLPNYYPDSEVTDNISLTDNQSTFSQDKERYVSLDTLPWSIAEQTESISYDENIVLTKKTEGLYARPKTIRGPTPYQTFDYEKLPQFSQSDKIKEAEKGGTETSNEPHSSLEFETNTNCDEIKLNNENIRKEEELLIQEKQEAHLSVNEIIDKLKTQVDVSLEKPLKPDTKKAVEKFDSQITTSNVKTTSLSTHSENQIKTQIEVCSGKIEEFKSIVTVEKLPEILLCTEEESKSHSHNYLKEFLETQKGSKRPLQSFLAKKLSNLTRRHQHPKSNLASNQFYSLPDITVSKNLHKCEKIDRKLRKCDKLTKAPEKLSENRFIVNIGNHFDITAKSNIPVDFQVKIAKVPKKSKKSNKSKEERDKEFEEAVRNVNSTLQSNGFCIDFNNNHSKELILDVNTVGASGEVMDPEMQEKVDNIKNYWTKMVGGDNEKCDEEKEANHNSIEMQTKVNHVKKKFEPTEEIIIEDKSPTKIQLVKQMFEPKPKPEKTDKISPLIKETCNYFEKPLNNLNNKQTNCYESLCPSSVELITQNDNNERPKKSLIKSNSVSAPEFDHVRYKVIKPDLFNKKILANCNSEAQFEGLMQYLQDYSFQELLIDNNIVIIEPIRSKVMHQTVKSHKKVSNAVPNRANEDEEFDDVKQGIRKHFFYHPIRVNKEVNDDELPNPEVVRQARQFFEKAAVVNVKAKDSLEDVAAEKERCKEGSVDPDKDKCSSSSLSDGEQEPEQMFDSLDNTDCCTEYVSEDILEKIREYGTTVTYYGGNVVKHHQGQPILTKVIMEEIKDNEKRCMECNGCRRRSDDRSDYQGLKFKLIKSNSCNSRLELVGATNKEVPRKVKNGGNSKMDLESNNHCIKELKDENVVKGSNEYPDKNAINENIKMNNNKLGNTPRIIGEERKVPDNNKYVQWRDIKKEPTYGAIQLNDKRSLKNFDYHEKTVTSKRPCDMEFEPYEVAL